MIRKIIHMTEKLIYTFYGMVIPSCMKMSNRCIVFDVVNTLEYTSGSLPPPSVLLNQNWIKHWFHNCMRVLKFIFQTS